MLKCDKCGAGIVAGAKFCAQCGDPVTEADKVAGGIPDSSVATVQIKFGQSSSPNYFKAVSICEQLPTYQVTGNGKQVEHSVTMAITEVELLVNLYELVGSWKSSQMLINGHAETKKALTYYGVGCYRTRQKAFKPEQYCFGEQDYNANIWGCKRLNMPMFEWGGGWLSYGEFDSNGVWHLDKRRIRHELQLSVNENELCPVLDRQKIFDTLDKLPEKIDPRSDKNWEYTTRYEEVENEFKEVAVGVRPVLKKIDKYVVGEYKPIWQSGDERPSISSEQSEQLLKVEISERPSPHETRNSVGASSVDVSESSQSRSVWLVLIVLVAVFLYFALI